MAATSRRRSSQGLTSSGSSTQLARRGSASGKAGGNRGRFDPTFMMSSNAAAASGARDTSPHEPAAAQLGPRQKSSDRLHRSAESSSHLSTKRSKSYTHLGPTANDGGRKRRKSTTKRDKDESEDGWTSASADNTLSDNSVDLSSPSSPTDDALFLGIKKRPQAMSRSETNTTLSDSRTDFSESSVQQPDTPRASARQLDDDQDVQHQSGLAAPPLARGDTSKTLTTDESPHVSEPAQVLSELQNNLASLRIDNSATSTEAAEGGLGVGMETQARHHRAASNASNRTLRSSMPMPSSPGSIRSRSSLSSRFLLYPREVQAVAPPKLDTHNALAGRLGSRHEDRGDLLNPMAGTSSNGRKSSALTSSTSAPAGWDQRQSFNDSEDAKRKASITSMTDSGITLTSPAASVGDVSREFPGRAGRYPTLELGSHSELAGPAAADRRRTTSTQSLTAADAAKLAAKLRLARDSMDDMASSGYHTVPRGYNPRLDKYKKPIISTFAKNDVSEAPQAIEVQDNSVYSYLFSQAHDSKGDSNRGRRMIRYIMGYGVSGPPIEKSSLSDALLGPSLDMDDFESSWAPALANAAGLGAMSGQNPMRSIETEYGIVAPDATAAVGGPNSTPLHLIHGLTTTSPDPFPLDPSDVPALQEDAEAFGSRSALGQPPIQFVDPGLIRAIAITTHAISTHRFHVVTRRYADPMREGIERVARSSGRYGAGSKTAGSALNSPQVAARWGRKTAPNSPIGSRSDLRDGRPSFDRRNTSETAQQRGHMSSQSSSNLAGQLYTLVDAAEHPVRSIKRVWSGGLSRGGLAALTRTDEEP